MAERDRGEDAGEGLLARWSRLKRARSEPSEAPPAVAPQADEAPAIAPVAAGPEPGGEAAEAAGAVRVEDLPDIESLTYESDFTVFLAKGVPKALRSRARAPKAPRSRCRRRSPARSHPVTSGSPTTSPAISRATT